MDGIVAVNQLAVFVPMYGLDECPGLLSRLEGITWDSVLHVCRHGGSPV